MATAAPPAGRRYREPVVARPGKILRGGEWGRQLQALMSIAPADATAWMERHTRLLKSDDFSRVGLLTVQQRPCYLKLYLAKTRLQQLGFRLGYGRGLHSFDAAAALLRDDLPVPEPLACLLLPEGMALLTKALPGAVDLRQWWLATPRPGEAEQRLRGAGETLALLHCAGYAHGDFKWSNVLCRNDALALVDLERVQKVRVRHSPAPRQLRDLARFTVDSEELGASREQLQAFLAGYLGTAPCSREQLLLRLNPLLPPIRARHQRRYGLQPRPLL